MNPSTIFQTQIGFSSVSLSGVGVYTQLPSIPADMIGFGRTSIDLRLATSGNPGLNFLLLNTAASGNSANASPSIPCAGDCANLWVANDVSGTQTVAFLWLREAARPTYQAC